MLSVIFSLEEVFFTGKSVKSGNRTSFLGKNGGEGRENFCFFLKNMFFYMNLYEILREKK